MKATKAKQISTKSRLRERRRPWYQSSVSGIGQSVVQMLRRHTEEQRKLGQMMQTLLAEGRSNTFNGSVGYVQMSAGGDNMLIIEKKLRHSSTVTSSLTSIEPGQDNPSIAPSSQVSVGTASGHPDLPAVESKCQAELPAVTKAASESVKDVVEDGSPDVSQANVMYDDVEDSDDDTDSRDGDDNVYDDDDEYLDSEDENDSGDSGSDCSDDNEDDDDYDHFDSQDENASDDACIDYSDNDDSPDDFISDDYGDDEDHLDEFGSVDVDDDGFDSDCDSEDQW